MIIKAALRTLRQRRPVARRTVREAVADIDEEVARLNRIVNDVLDFARPITFDLAPVDLNALCRDAASGARSGDAGVAGRRSSSIRTLAPIVTDGERLRLALVNMLDERAPRGDRPDGAGTAPTGSIRLTTLATASRRASSIDGRDTRRRHRSRTNLAAGLRPLLHDQARRHRPRPAIAQEHRRGAGRHDRVSSAPGRGHRDPHRAAGRRSSASRPHGRAMDVAWRHDRGSILLVDDEAKILKALGRALRDAGHEVVDDDERRAKRSGCSAQRAVRRARRRQPDAGADRPRPDSRAGRVDGRRASGRRF